MDGTNSYTSTDSLDITMTSAVHVTMYDREQTPQHCAMWKHQVYVDGVSDPNGEGWLGDSHLELPVGASLSIEENNRLKVTHVFDGATYDEYYTPYLYILDNWEEVGIDTTKTAKNWRLWKNVSSPTLDNVTETYGPGSFLVLDKSFRNVALDVEFMDVPINPPDDNPTDIISSESYTVPDSPQTSDNTIYILAALALILLLSTLCVIWDRSPRHI